MNIEAALIRGISVGFEVLNRDETGDDTACLVIDIFCVRIMFFV
jgi:hypothetical protein